MKSIYFPNLIACPSCDELLELQPLKKGEKMICPRCHSTVVTGNADPIKAFFLALTAIILYFIANCFSFITLTIQGDTTTISIFSSVETLFRNQLSILGLLVMLCVIIMPLWYLLSVLWIVSSYHFKIYQKTTQKFLHFMYQMSPWNMLEVYLVGVVVTLVKIMSLAEVRFNDGFWAFCALMFCSILINLNFNLRDAFLKVNTNG